MLIYKMRRAAGLLDLREMAEIRAPALAVLPVGFLNVARDEYRQAWSRLSGRITFDKGVAA